MMQMTTIADTFVMPLTESKMVSF